SCHTLAACLMNCDSSTAPLPNPPNSFYKSEVQIFIDSEPHEGSNGSNEKLTEADICKVTNKDGKLDRDYLLYIHSSMQRWGIRYFTLDWNSNFDDQFNQIICQFFIKVVWKWGLTTNRFGIPAKKEAISFKMDSQILMAIFWRHSQYLSACYKAMQKKLKALENQRIKNSTAVALHQKSLGWQQFLEDINSNPAVVNCFNNKYCNSDDEISPDPAAHNMLVCFSKQPYWRSKIASNFIDWVEKKKHEDCGIQITGIKNRPKRGPASRARSWHHPPTVNEKAVVPAGLPSDWYAKEFLLFLT
ncbi:hypothetical protein PPACK8108_LOCUS26231, partial [Phakopsora pachyrhizi]